MITRGTGYPGNGNTHVIFQIIDPLFGLSLELVNVLDPGQKTVVAEQPYSMVIYIYNDL